MLRSRPDLQAAMAREKGGMGGRAKLQRMLNGEKFDTVINSAKDPLYRLERMGGAEPAAKSSKIKSSALQDATEEYPPATMTTRIKPVSQSIAMPDTEEYNTIRKALALVDSVHDDGRLPKTRKVGQRNRYCATWRNNCLHQTRWRVSKQVAAQVSGPHCC
jgi:hypothetical protein